MRDKIVSFTLHFCALVIALILVWYGVGSLFYKTDKLLGWDTHAFLSYVVDFSKHGGLPVGIWKSNMYEGMSRLVDSTWFNFYIIQPLVVLLGPITSVKVFVLAYYAIFIIFCYFLFFRLSKKRFLSIGLAVASGTSALTHGALYSTGLVNSFLSQAWIVGSILFLFIFLEERRLGNLIFSCIFFALAIYTHPATTALFGIPSILLLIFFSWFEGKSWGSWGEKFVVTLIFFILTFLIGLVEILPELLTIFEGKGFGNYSTLATSHKETFSLMFTSTIWIWPVGFILTLVLAPLIIGRKNLRRTLPFWLMFLYFLLFELTLYLGLNPTSSFSFPQRFFWFLPFTLGTIIAGFWYTKENLNNIKLWFKRILLVGFGFLFISSALMPKSTIFNYLDLRTISFNQPNLSLDRYYNLFVNKENWREKLSDKYITDERIYIADPMEKTFWDMFMNVPQTGGVFMYANKQHLRYFDWFMVINSSYNWKEGGIPKAVAERNSLWFSDWYATRYYLSSPGDGELAGFFNGSDFPLENKIDIGDVNKSTLYKLNADAISPVVCLTNAPTIGFIGKQESWELFLRNLAIADIDSKELIPVYLGESPENVLNEDLSIMDTIFLYDYIIKNTRKYIKGWSSLKNFAESGGVVYIEVGSNSPEKQGTELSELFPVKAIEKGGVSDLWSVSGPWVNKMDFKSLSPLRYENGLWDLAYFEENELKSDAETLLRLENKSVVVQSRFGKGKVILSGINLIYRPIYYKDNALNEVKLLETYLRQGISLENNLVKFNIERPIPEKVKVTGIKSKGVLFKENDYGGWSANIVVGGKRYPLQIISAGLGLMYARIPTHYQDANMVVEFIYKGRIEYWIALCVSILSMVGAVYILVMYGKRTLGDLNNKMFNQLKKWWEKDDGTS